jgi:hypothetical protein
MTMRMKSLEKSDTVLYRYIYHEAKVFLNLHTKGPARNGCGAKDSPIRHAQIVLQILFFCSVNTNFLFCTYHYRYLFS